MNLSLIGILVGLFLLMFLAFRGHSIIWVAPVAAMVVALMSGYNLFDAYLTDYMTGAGNYVITWFPAFFLGAVYGKIMDATGAARSLANKIISFLGQEWALASVVIPCLLMTYGGISLFVVVFVVYPMGYAIYREANIPRTLLPGAIAFGAFGISMTALPGTPQIQNLIPTKFFGTTAAAAPLFSIVAALLMAVPGYIYLSRRIKKVKASGEGFVEDPKFVQVEFDESKIPSWHWLSGLIPILVVIFMLNIFPKILKSSFGIAWEGNQPIVVALISGILICTLMNANQLKTVMQAINDGANGSILAIMNTACAVGFGSVVKVVPGFATLTDAILKLPGSPLFSLALAVNLLAGATGSASGGLSISLEALAPKYIELAAANNIPVAAMHRIASISCGGLDTLPQNGAVLTLLAVSNCTHKESYKDIAVTTAIIPVVVSLVLGLLGDVIF
uniref:GntP family permease n=1 Tax=Anaerococcus mediterraneensis TaxID=1870984 RepID=UPI0009313849|nr:GntP family permease [Anaerococcus mediterraneensis]